jgi:integral membrane protein
MKNAFRILTFLEGTSNVILLIIAVPLKHFFEIELLVKLVGMPHGLLFIAYCIMAIVLKNDYEWDNSTLAKVLLASVIPFGTFWVDKKYLR